MSKSSRKSTSQTSDTKGAGLSFFLLLSAQLIAVFLEARYGMSSLEKFKHVEGFYTPRDKGSEWTIRFFKNPSQPGGYFTIRVDDRTGQVTDYSPGE